MQSQSNANSTAHLLQSVARYGALALCLCGALAASLAEAATLKIQVLAGRTETRAMDGLGVTKGAVVANFKYLLNIDNTGSNLLRAPTPGLGCSPQDAGYPQSCQWTSIAGAKSHSPIFTQGDQSDFANGLDLPDGRYLISVMADGYKLDGQHFSVRGADLLVDGVPPSPAGVVTVVLQPTPLPDAQIQAAVFEDIAPVNSAPDLPAEHGLAGFQGHITDYLGEVTTNLYGDPLCSRYDAAGGLIAGSGGRCLSACYVVNAGVDLGTVAARDAAGRCPVDAAGLTLTRADGSTGLAPAGAVVEGKIKIPNLGPNRYALSVTPPDGSGWVQTTTLEGNHDWDAWVMEGATGLDTEFMVAGEPFPAIIFGYVPVPGTPSGLGQLPPLSGDGRITGVVEAVKIYVPTSGGVGGLPGAIWGGLQGARIDKPIAYPWVTLTSLGNGDSVVWVGQGDAAGRFSIPQVPAGSYTLTWWDEPQNTILDLVNVTVGAGETVDMGILPLAGWWTFFDGYVFNDSNRNGIKDVGEPGLPGYTLTLRKRENSLMDRGSTVVSTDANGYYKFEAAYPMTQWLVMEAYDDLHYTTGVTYQADNQPLPTTILGAGVDVSVHPIIGLSGTLDWGKHNYDASGANGIDPRNGGIVGTVSYDTTRNETDPRYAAVEDWQPSIADVTVWLFAPVACGTTLGAGCDASGRFELEADGSLRKGKRLNAYVSETWQRPTGCVARGADGTPMRHGVDEQVLPLDDALGCIEAPLMGIQFGTYATDQGTPAANFGAAVDGNYGFGEGCLGGTLDASDPAAPRCLDANAAELAFTTLPAGNYLVQVEIPRDRLGRPMYKVTREEDINIANGDAFLPAVPPSACAGALHTVNSRGNPSFMGIGGSPYEGQAKPLCDTKLVTLANGKSIAPAFNLYTDVPIPGRHWFIIIDDLNFSSNPRSVTFGEKAGMPFVPVGIYDWTDRLVTTVESDYNGLADVLLPSTNRISCPTPSGVCANLYRYVGNDPGVPGRLNLNFNPQFRTIAAEFEVLPGLLVPADLAPTQVGVTVQLPGSQTTAPVMCKLDDTSPEIYRIDRPYGGPNQAFTLSGKGFGASGTVKFDATALPSSWVAWSDTAITVTPTDYNTVAAGPRQLSLVAANGQSTVNGITYHYLRSTGDSDVRYNPPIREVGPGKPFAPVDSLPAAANHAIQRALDAAPPGALVVVYPNEPSANPRQNPRGAYYENLIINKRVKLQGVGPGSPNGVVRGSIIDGSAFAGDSPVATDWYTNLTAKTWSGNQTIYDGAVVSLFLPASGNNAFPSAYNARTAASIDGFDLRGGDQQGFPGNINAIGGTPTGLPAGLITQGGAIFANGYARNLQITNNLVQNNGGAYGAIRIGTPDLPPPDTSAHNDKVVIAFNRIIANAGTNQAGGIGLFSGSDDYQVASNDICGNFSSEYGGGISAVGLSPRGSINNNRIYFNRAFDEGGGIMIAGALPASTSSLSPGSGPVSIFNNLIQANLSNDDGGGVRFLMAGNYPMQVYNNFIVNNISTHEGGGIALNDTPNVRFFNNTVMKNLTTATALTSSGAAAPAGLSTSANSSLLQATLTGGVAACGSAGNAACFSKPLLFNNIFWDNRAGTRTGSAVLGLSEQDANHWDMGVADAAGMLSPTNSLLQSETSNHFDVEASPTNRVDQDPAVLAPYDVAVTFNTWRNNPAFLGAILISADLPPNLMGNYHILDTSPAYNAGAADKNLPADQGGGTVAAPAQDIDRERRPAFDSYDIGADEVPSATANLGISKTDGLSSVTPGQALTYTIRVSNAGPFAVSGARVRDTMSAKLTQVTWTCVPLVSCAASSGSGNIDTLVTLANGASAVFTVQATVADAASGNLVNTASVTAPGGTLDPSPGNNSATDTDSILVPADLSISNTDGQSLVSRGDALRYTIVVSNLGTSAVNGAIVSDIFPNALSGPIGWTCTSTGGATCGGPSNGSGRINRSVNLPLGSSLTFSTTSGTLSTSTGASTLNNTATVTLPAGFQDTNPANNSATDSDTINGIHVADLNWTHASTSATQWSAAVTLTVHDAFHNPVAGATVSGVWLLGGSGGSSCVSDASGQCTLTRSAIPLALGPLQLTQITFYVGNLSRGPDGYQSALNHDPDAPASGQASNGSSITVPRP
jgi:uncharacterized repeat protein (TIGR01451 family)